MHADKGDRCRVAVHVSMSTRITPVPTHSITLCIAIPLLDDSSICVMYSVCKDGHSVKTFQPLS